jgi:hypothetical protein
MKKIFGFLMLTLLIGGGAGPVVLNTGCDDLKGPCDSEETKTGTVEIDLKYLESWHKEGTYGILRFIYPAETIFFVCTDRTLTYQFTLEKYSSIQFAISPQARLIWKYSAPKPSKAVLTGTGNFVQLFSSGNTETKVFEGPISLAYSESSLGGYFIPGIEIKIATLGNQSDDYKFVWNNFLLYDSYKVTYRMTY